MSRMQKMFEDGIKDAYHAEKQLIKALPKMAKKASNPDLKSAFEMHLEETKQHAERLEQLADKMGFKPNGMVCKGMQGIIEEAEEHMGKLDSDAAGDAEIVMLAQKVEHYEIATYGTLCEWAKEMGHNDALDLLKQNLSSEENTDKKLTELAEKSINPRAIEEMKQAPEGNRASVM